jgi:hypothetical protein
MEKYRKTYYRGGKGKGEIHGKIKNCREEKSRVESLNRSK